MTRLGYAVLLEAHAGLMNCTGPRNGDPVKVCTVHERHVSGSGCVIDCSLLESQVSYMANIAANYLICGKQAERLGTDHASIVPYGCLRTKDGMMAIAAGNDRQFLGLVKCLGLHERARDVRFGSNAARVEDQEVLIKQLEGVTTEQIAGSDKFAFAPVNNMKQVMSDPQVLHRDMILEMDHPSAEKIKLPGVPVKFTGGKTQNHSPPPILSQHTEMILRDILRRSDGEIQSLSSYRVVGETNQS